MKYYLSLIAAAALGLSACSQQETAPAASAEVSAPAPTASEPAPAASDAVASAEVKTGACEVVIEGNDQMKFNTDHIDISKQCKEFTITLKHVGTMPKAAMGHNVVIAKTADISAVVADGTSAGPDGDYVKAGDERIIAHTKLVGGGEEAKITFDPSKLAVGNDYSFFCSFPGHESLMHGSVKLVD